MDAFTETDGLYTKTLRETDTFARSYFDTKLQRARAIDPAYEILWQHIRTCYFAGGKRMRPYLTFVGYGGYSSDILDIAFAQELLHVSMLMHDDVIDRDTVRHGTDNINGLYGQRYGAVLEGKNLSHYSHSAAILAGDALLSEAYHLVAQSQLPPATMTKILQRLHQSIFEVIGGELLDIEAGFIQHDTYDPLTIYRYKTAGYSFIGPLVIGALGADADELSISALEKYGTYAGIAFQLQDDVLGIFGDKTTVGKSLHSDFEEQKYTYLLEWHRAHSTDAMTHHLDQAFSPDASQEDYAQLTHDMEISGARRATETLAREYYAKATSELDQLGDSTAGRELHWFTEVLLNRRA